MKTLIFGATGILILVAYAIYGNPALFLQEHSIILVFGGTGLVFLLSTPVSVLNVIHRAVRSLKNDEHLSDYADEFTRLAKSRSLEHRSKNALIAYAQELWDQGVDPDLFVVLLSQRRMELENETLDAVQALKNLAKYPPAMGMIGTVMGMIALFSQLDQQKNNVGTNLALAMTATFFGLLVSNALISPLADRLQVRHVYLRRLYSNIYQLILLINQGEPAALINGELDERSA
jgi:chemotaxis protein MotA